jgi:hypothetical protein
MRTKVLAAMGTLALSGASLGQTVLWVQRVHGDTGQNNAEVALGVNRAGSDVTVAWIDYFNPGNLYHPHVHYNIAADGEHFNPSDATHLPISGSTLDSADPTVAYFRAPGHSGEALIGALKTDTTDGFWTCNKPAGGPLGPAVRLALPGVGVDHVMFALGPGFNGGPDVAGAFWNRQYFNPNAYRLRAFTSTSSPLGTWTLPDIQVGQTAPGNIGGCGAPVILHNQGLAGRWVMAYADESGYPAATVWTGTQWIDASPVTQAPEPGTQTLEDIFLFGGLPNNSGAGCLAMASDPSDSRKLYMIFTARAASSGLGTIGNGDLFIAQSTDGGVTFPGSQVVHLTDAMLGELGGQEILSTVAVDSAGGVNIGYYVAVAADEAWPPSKWNYRFKYARITNFGSPTQTVTNLVLPGVGWFDLSAAGLSLSWMGDYTGSDSRGCDVYFGFMSRHEGGTLNVYVAKVRACAEPVAADVDSDGAVTPGDALLFTEYFGAGDPRADITRDSSINTADFVLFSDSYACGCNPQ